MSIQVVETKLPGVLQITPQAFEDHRGTYLETYNREMYAAAGIDMDFVQDDISVSDRMVLRGIHGDAETWKLVSCLEGKFYLVVVNNDSESEHYLKWTSFTLSEDNRMQVLIPPKHGNGHLVLSERAIFHYKQTTYYNPKGQFTYRYDDPKLGLWWPCEQPILSMRDALGRWPDAHCK
jgi:dTDP-4-dehydrorhamnose 3,5-epimerase and related enzymes